MLIIELNSVREFQLHRCFTEILTGLFKKRLQQVASKGIALTIVSCNI